MRIELVSCATHPRETAAYYDGLWVCYARFQAERAAHGRADGDRRAGLFLALARSRQEILGGVGIHLRLGPGTLPVERALAGNRLLRERLDGHLAVAELSGLWVADFLRGSGVSLRLMQAAMAALPMLGANVGVGFSHQHALALYANVGLLPDPELRALPYPDPRYASTVLWADALGLGAVTPANRRRILHARRVFGEGNKLRFPADRSRVVQVSSP